MGPPISGTALVSAPLTCMLLQGDEPLLPPDRCLVRIPRSRLPFRERSYTAVALSRSVAAHFVWVGKAVRQ